MKDLFALTFEADSEARAHALASESNEHVRRRVEAMLLAHDSTGGPLDKSVIASVESIDWSPVVAVPSMVGRKLGPYRVVREIGRGGMGAVYEALREDAQFEQRVAIKTLRVGADSELVLKRFHQERRILAGLQHANIAALYDGAVTDDGLPYFVLEYVEGIAIDKYCNDHQLELRDRIELFLQVVAAVQHAHQQLVVHRDIKPSNILVTQQGVVKLVDFGIAKLLDEQASGVTGDLAAPLTISYASPEQVKGEPITTASDVYSLGVVLYRLLAGVTPLNLDEVSLDRAVSALCSTLPPPPSTAATAEAAGAMRLGSREKLKRVLSGDLDAILMTALRKEPERRYATVRELGEDLRRYVEGLPVRAVRDSAAYRLRKFVRRQRALVAAAVVATIALAAGGIGTLWQARTARVEARRAESVSSFLQMVIGAGDLSAGARSPRLGPAATVSELLDSAASRLPREFADDPQARADIHLALGRAFSTQQRWRAARAQFELARALGRSRSGEPRVEMARALQGLAGIEMLSGGPPPRQLALQAQQILDKLGQQNTIDYARTLRFLGLMDALDGSWHRADTLLSRARKIYSQTTPAPNFEAALALADHAAIREMTGRSWNESVADYRRALALVDSIPGNVAEKADLLWYVARAEATGGNRARADSLGLVALAVLERASGPQSGAVAQQLAQLASFARARGDTATAHRYIERSIRIADADPEIIALIRERVQSEYAMLKLARGEIAAAESLSRGVYTSRAARGNWGYLLEAQLHYAFILLRREKFADAEPILLDGFRASGKVKATEFFYRRSFAEMLVRLYQKRGQPELARPFLAVLPDSVQKRLQTSSRAR